MHDPWAAQRRRIYELQSEQRQQLKAIEEGSLGTAMSESVAELSSLDQHTSDLANETLERSKDLGLRAQAEYVLSACAEALERMARGEYGVCASCGVQIPEQRLEALPYTTLCVTCSEEASAQHQMHRPVEEEVMHTPFADHSDFGEDDYGIDRDDTWEIVAEHGTANTPQDTPRFADDDRDGEEKGNG